MVFRRAYKKKQQPRETENIVIKKSAVAMLINDQSYLLNNVKGDVEFTVGNDTVLLHSSVLMARSKWFIEYCSQKTKEQQVGDDEVVVSNFVDDLSQTEISIVQTKFDNENRIEKFTLRNVSFNAFRELIRFIYSSKLSKFDENEHDLLKLAKLFGMESLSNKVQKNLEIRFSEFDLNEVIQLLKLANKCNARELKRVCIDYINENGKIVIQTKSWEQLTREDPKLVIEIFRQDKASGPVATPRSSESLRGEQAGSGEAGDSEPAAASSGAPPSEERFKAASAAASAPVLVDGKRVNITFE